MASGFKGTRVVPFASIVEIVAGTVEDKAMAPAEFSAAMLALPAAADNAGAAAAGVAVGGLYRINADPSAICVRTA